MMTRRLFVIVGGALTGLASCVAVLAAAPAIEILTFSGPVALPGITLRAATYSFEVVDYRTSGSVIRVRDNTTRQSVFLGLTDRVERPTSVKKGPSIVFAESPRGVPPPIIVWYPSGLSVGHRFSYPRH